MVRQRNGLRTVHLESRRSLVAHDSPQPGSDSRPYSAEFARTTDAVSDAFVPVDSTAAGAVAARKRVGLASGPTG